MTFSRDMELFSERMNLLNQRVKSLDEKVSDMESNGLGNTNLEPYLERLQKIEGDYFNTEKLNTHLEQISSRKLRELSEQAVTSIANRRVTEAIQEFADGQVGKAGMEDWLNDNLGEYVEGALDNLMCEKTQRTIEEYSLVNYDGLSSAIDDEFSNRDYVTEDDLDSKAHELKGELVNEISSELEIPDDDRISELAMDAISTFLENSDLYDEISAHTKSQIIVSQVVNDAQCLNRVKHALERSGALQDESGEKDD